MKHISRKNYQSDKYYKRIVRAVEMIVERQGFVAPIDLFIEMGLLEKDAIAEWRAGRLTFLERAICCNLACASRILRILRLHALDLNLRPSHTGYMRRTRSGRMRLRFTKTGEPALEQAYAQHFVKTPARSERVGQEGADTAIAQPSDSPMAAV